VIEVVGKRHGDHQGVELQEEADHWNDGRKTGEWTTGGQEGGDPSKLQDGGASRYPSCGGRPG